MLRATTADGTETAEVALRITPSRTALTPRITEAPGHEGQYHPGDVMVLEGQGFQPGGRLPQLGTCALPFEAGVPDRCSYPEVPEVTIAADGTFELEYPMPTGADAQRCSDSDQGCAIAEVPGEGASPLWRIAFLWPR